MSETNDTPAPRGEQTSSETRPKKLTEILAALPRLGTKPINQDYLIACAKLLSHIGLDPIVTHGVTAEGWCTCGVVDKETGEELLRDPLIWSGKFA